MGRSDCLHRQVQDEIVARFWQLQRHVDRRCRETARAWAREKITHNAQATVSCLQVQKRQL
eukprot:570450-Pleurochrysis_carterae.AAC.3